MKGAAFIVLRLLDWFDRASRPNMIRINRVAVDVGTGDFARGLPAHPAILSDSLHRMMTPTI